MKRLTLSFAAALALVVFFITADYTGFNCHNAVRTVLDNNYGVKNASASSLSMKPAVAARYVGTDVARDKQENKFCDTAHTIKDNPLKEECFAENHETKTHAQGSSRFRHALAPLPNPPLEDVTRLIGEAGSFQQDKVIAIVSEEELAGPIRERDVVDATTIKVRLVPAPVPVLTPEEAIKANDEAIKNNLIVSSSEAERANEKDGNTLAKTISKEKLVPSAVPLLTPEEAVKANKDAIRFQRNMAIESVFNTFFHNNKNRIFFIISLLPLLLIIDVIPIRRKKNKKRNRISEVVPLQRRMCVLFSVSLLVFGLFVFVPWSVYFGNSSQFSFIFQDFVNWNLALLSVTIIVLSCVLLIVPPAISDFLVAIIAGLGLCVYLQAMFMNCFLGEMNGTEEFGKHNVWGIINLAIWLFVIILSLCSKRFLRERWRFIMAMISLSVFLLELTATVSMLFPTRESYWKRANTKIITDGSNQFQLSSEKNVFVIILDALGSEVLKQCFAESPDLKKSFKDFTWYIDACSNYQFTFPGVIHEITGALLRPSNNATGIYKNFWHSPSAKSFYSQIKNAGYDSRLFIDSDYCLGVNKEFFSDYFSNLYKVDISYSIDHKALKRCLFKMAGFSGAPYFLKKCFIYDFTIDEDVVSINVHNMNAEIVEDSRPSNYYNKMMKNGITTNAPSPVVAFHYTYGSHKPCVENEYCVRQEIPFDSPLPTAKGCLFMVSEFMRLLKSRGIYDQTAIFVFSDHGNHYLEPKRTHDLGLLIKPFNSQQNELAIDHSKVLGLDILPTILSVACGEDADFSSFDGIPVSKIPEDRKRVIQNMLQHSDIPPFDGNHFTRNCVSEHLVPDQFPSDYDYQNFYRSTFLRFIPFDENISPDSISQKYNTFFLIPRP